MRTNTTCNAANWSKLQGKDSCGFSGICPEQQEQDHDHVQSYQLARLYDATQHVHNLKEERKNVETENLKCLNFALLDVM